MPPKRNSGGGAPSAGPAHPVVTTLLLAGAVGWGLGLLVLKGALAWPPTRLVSSLATVAGCLALVGPIVVARSGKLGGGLGEMIWTTGGLLIWIFNLVAIADGGLKGLDWATPLGPRTMGLFILAVTLAGLRSGSAGRDWSWTNVTGWALGLFWIAAGLATWILAPGSGLAAALAAR